MSVPSYRGQPIQYAVHDRKADTYTLVGADGDYLAELKAREFLSLHNRGNLEVRSGRYRQAGSKDQRSANRKSGQAGRDDPFAILPPISPWLTWYDPSNQSNQVAGPGLSLADIKRAKALLGSWGGVRIVGEVPKPPLKREGIVAGEIVGHRCWRIEKGWLTSVYQQDVWKPGCVLEGRGLDDWDERGIHAWKDPRSKEYHSYIRAYLNEADDNPFGLYLALRGGPDNSHRSKRPAMVTGTVFLWGDVVEHERGYRAEFGRVRSLDWLYPDATMMGREQQALDDLRKLYGV